jgi:hypothetical protein
MHKLIHFNLFYGQFVSVDNSSAVLIRLLIGGQRDRCSIPSRCKNVFLLWSLQTGSGAHPVSNSMHIQRCFSEGKAAGAWSWPFTPFFSAIVKNHFTIFPLRLIFVRLCRDKFIYATTQSVKWSDVLSIAHWISGRDSIVSLHCCISTGSLLLTAS